MSGLVAWACRPVAGELGVCAARAPGDNPMPSRAHSSDSLNKRANRTLDGGMLLPPTFPNFFKATRGKGRRSLLARTRGAHDIVSLSTVQHRLALDRATLGWLRGAPGS